jgi:hypothetical protein
MRSTIQSEQSKKNGARSHGPVSSSGKERSKLNAVTHGLRARTLVLPGESKEDFAHLVDITTKSLKPRDEFELRLAERTAGAEWVRERAENVLHARLATLINEADEREDDDIYILCKTLFWDARGPHGLYGLSPVAHGGPRSSSSRGPSDPTDPHLIVRRLERSRKGCEALIGHWEALLFRIKENLGWQAPDRLMAIRLMGKQPVDVGLDERIVVVYVGSFAIKPGTRLNGYGDLKCDMGTLDYKRFLKRVRSRWPSVKADDPEVARKWLIDLVEQNIDRLRNRLEVYRQCAQDRAEREAECRKFDDSPEGERLRRYGDACDRRLSRSLADYRKYLKESNRRDERSSADGGQDCVEDARGGLMEVGREVGAASEPEESVVSGQLSVAGKRAGEHGNLTNEPEREGDLVDAEGFAVVENENVTNEPEREGGGDRDSRDDGVER